MNRLMLLAIVLALTVTCLALPSEAEQPTAAHVQLADDAGVAQRTEVSAGVGERLIIVSENQQTKIEVAVRKLPPDKRVIIYVELLPKQSGETGTVPMGLPLGRWFRLVNNLPVDIFDVVWPNLWENRFFGPFY